MTAVPPLTRVPPTALRMVADDEARIDLGVDGLGPAEHIGRGGAADVYRAEQLGLRRTVAIKVLRAQSKDPSTESRFQSECEAIGSVSDQPHIIGVYEGGLTRNGRAYLVMEYLPGGSLYDLVHRTGTLSQDEVIDVGIKIGSALSAAHRVGVLHRDVKPSNIMISAGGEPALGDFGIARIEGGPQTLTGLVTASFAHASPEVLGGNSPTVASDIYSLASTMFELLVGWAPYYSPSDKSVWPLMKRILSEPMPSPESVGMSPEFGRVFIRATARSAGDRYADVDQFVGDLAALGPSSGRVRTVADPNKLNVRSEGVDAPLVTGLRQVEVETPPPGPPPAPAAAPMQNGAAHAPADPFGGGASQAALPENVENGARQGSGQSDATETGPVDSDGRRPDRSDPGAEPPSRRRRNRRRWLSFSLLALIVCVGAAVGLAALGGDDSTQVLPATIARDSQEPPSSSSDDPGVAGPAASEAEAPMIEIEGATDGPLVAGEPVDVSVVAASGGELMRYVIDGNPEGDPAERLEPYRPTVGRHSLAVEVTSAEGVEILEPVELYAIDEVPQTGYRANLASVPADPANWEMALELFDRLVIAGHEAVELRASDDYASLSPGFWNIYVAGFGQDGEAAGAHCQRFGLAVPDECFAAFVDPNA